MKTTFDITDILYRHLNDSSLKTEINGVICKKRPVDSTAEDVVINALPINNLDLQTAIVNVNIHVPNIDVDINGRQDNTQPDFARLKFLADMAVDILSNRWIDDYSFDVQQQSGPVEDVHDHFVNIRVEFISENILN